jgi:hypothetical protein
MECNKGYAPLLLNISKIVVGIILWTPTPSQQWENDFVR